jgi:hypothetical protein
LNPGSSLNFFYDPGQVLYSFYARLLICKIGIAMVFTILDFYNKLAFEQARGMAQIVQHLPSKFKSLNFKPSTTKKKKKTKMKQNKRTLHKVYLDKWLACRKKCLQ